MVNTEIKSGYNKVIVRGDSDHVTIVMQRGGTDGFKIVINRDPGIFERIWPACYMDGLLIIRPTEEIFKSRIRRAVKIAVESSLDWDDRDKKQVHDILKQRTHEEQRNMDIDEFVGSLKCKEKPK